MTRKRSNSGWRKKTKKKPNSSRPRVVIGMMQRDEETRLEAWILYHARLFGFDALHIFDNGSQSPKVLATLKRYEALGVQVDYRFTGTQGFHNKGNLIARLFQQLAEDKRNQFFMPLDCDEFLVLGDQGQLTADTNAIFAQFETLLRKKHVMVTPVAYSNVLGRPGQFFESYRHHKVFFASFHLFGLGEGFHNTVPETPDDEYDTAFAQLHFHYRPHLEMALHSRNKLAHFIDVANPDEVARYDKTASHVKQYLSMPKEDYVNGFPAAGAINLPWFVPLCQEIGIPETFLAAI